MNLTGFRHILGKRGLDAAIFLNTSSMSESNEIIYFSGYKGVGALIVPRDKAPFLLVPKMEVERAKKGHIKSVYAFDKKKFFESIHEILKRKKIKLKKVGICQDSFSLTTYKALRKEFKKIQIKDISLDFLRLRSIKTPKELQIAKKAFSFANRIYDKTIFHFKDFKTETDVSAFMQYEAKKQGLDLSFPTIVASGKGASMPHHEPSPVKLRKGLCVIDFGIRYKGYCTDMTRTIGISSLTQKEKDIFSFVLDVQKKLVGKAQIGYACSKLYDDCVSLLGKHAKYFTHGLGHGVGVEIHELPNLTPGSKDILQKNMVVTVEPGVYVQGKYGIRIEDSIIIDKKPIILTRPTKELLIVK